MRIISVDAADILYQRGFVIEPGAMARAFSPAMPTRSERILCETNGDGVVHVETKGKRKGTRRERKARR